MDQSAGSDGHSIDKPPTAAAISPNGVVDRILFWPVITIFPGQPAPVEAPVAMATGSFPVEGHRSRSRSTEWTRSAATAGCLTPRLPVAGDFTPSSASEMSAALSVRPLASADDGADGRIHRPAPLSVASPIDRFFARNATADCVALLTIIGAARCRRCSRRRPSVAIGAAPIHLGVRCRSDEPRSERIATNRRVAHPQRTSISDRRKFRRRINFPFISTHSGSPAPAANYSAPTSGADVPPTFRRRISPRRPLRHGGQQHPSVRRLSKTNGRPNPFHIKHSSAVLHLPLSHSDDAVRSHSARTRRMSSTNNRPHLPRTSTCICFAISAANTALPFKINVYVLKW